MISTLAWYKKGPSASLVGAHEVLALDKLLNPVKELIYRGTALATTLLVQARSY